MVGGEPGGTFGINCHHKRWPYVPGINSNNQEQFDPDEAVAKGKIVQTQRALERKVRESKQLEDLATQLDDNVGKVKYLLQKHKYQSALRSLINQNDFLHRDYSREKIFNKQSAN